MIWLLLGCTGGPLPCEALQDQMERDVCLHERIRAAGPTQTDAVLADVEAITDPVVRNAAVLEFITTHRTLVPMEQGNALCQTLGVEHQGTCVHKLTAAHLNR